MEEKSDLMQEDLEAVEGILSEISKKYEDFTQEDFKQHLEDTYDSKQIVFDVTRENLNKFPTLIFHPRGLTDVILGPEYPRVNYADKLRKQLLTRNRDCEEDGVSQS